jgi:hypothetical protein
MARQILARISQSVGLSAEYQGRGIPRIS